LYKLGEFAQSQEALAGAQQVAARIGSPLTDSDVDLLAAWSWLAMGQTEQSLVFGERSVERAIATDNMDCICNGLACVGNGNLELRRIPEAISSFEKGIARSEISGAMKLFGIITVGSVALPFVIVGITLLCGGGFVAFIVIYNTYLVHP